jgi:hypothetical protein
MQSSVNTAGRGPVGDHVRSNPELSQKLVDDWATAADALMGMQPKAEKWHKHGFYRPLMEVYGAHTRTMQMRIAAMQGQAGVAEQEAAWEEAKEKAATYMNVAQAALRDLPL